MIMRKKAVAQLKEDRFDVLEDVKTVNIGNEMAVTLSKSRTRSEAKPVP